MARGLLRKIKKQPGQFNIEQCYLFENFNRHSMWSDLDLGRTDCYRLSRNELMKSWIEGNILVTITENQLTLRQSYFKILKLLTWYIQIQMT